MKRLTLALVLCCCLFLCLVPAANAAPPDLGGHWAAGEIQTLIDRGAIGGYPDGTFRPEGTVTRAEFSKILCQSLGLSASSGSAFSDLTGHWAAGDIYALTDEGILVPEEYGAQYGPDAAIHRREIAVMLVRAMGLNGSAVELSGQPTSFRDDAAIASYDKGYLYLAQQLGLVGGYADGTFRPSARATRAEASVMIVRLLKLMGLEKTPADGTPQAGTDPQGDPSKAPSSAPPQTPQNDGEIACSLTLLESSRSGRNALGEQYLLATLLLEVENRTAQALPVRGDQLRLVTTYSKDAQVAAVQDAFQTTVAAGQTGSVTVTAQILLPDNPVADMVLGGSIREIHTTLTLEGKVYDFPELDAALLRAVQ